MVQDKLHGVYEEFSLEGKLTKKINYVNGNKDGEELIYTNTGTLKSKGLFKNGKQIGKFEEFLPGGQLSQWSEYSNDSKVLEFEKFNQEKKLESKQILVHKDKLEEKAEMRSLVQEYVQTENFQKDSKRTALS